MQTREYTFDTSNEQSLKGSNSTMFGQLSYLHFPLAAMDIDVFLKVASVAMPWMLAFAFYLPFTRTIKEIVEEKELRIKEGMKMMGLKGGPFWAAWLTTQASIYAWVCVTVMLTIVIGNLMPRSDKLIVFLFLILWSMSSIAFACFLTNFFSKAKTSNVVASFLYFVFMLPYQLGTLLNLGRSVKLWSFLAPQSAMANAFGHIATAEMRGRGMNLDTWQERYSGVSFQDSFVFMLADFAIYGFLAWYLEKVLPSEFGVKERPFFLFTKRYWCKSSSSDRSRDLSVLNAGEARARLLDQKDSSVGDEIERLDPATFETMSENAEAIVRIHGLSKTFNTIGRPAVTALNNLNLNMYKNQIFALLGHNGAGKTTTIHILTGLYEPSSGEAEIAGNFIDTDMERIRESMGVCPQESILWPSLTVREHVDFFAGIKKVPLDVRERKIVEVINEVGLGPQIDTLASALSGGMKRKLSLAMALIGDPAVLFLDEPTSGMDPSARREAQELIKRQKQNRVIVLTTHYMEEADALADRIGIMSHGELKVCGSSLFLKSQFGVGYTCTLSLEEGAPGQPVKEVVQKMCAGAELNSEAGTEISLRLPFSSSPSFADLFEYLDAHKAELGIRSYTISVTTLEEVFLRVASTDKASQHLKDATADQAAGIMALNQVAGHEEKKSPLDFSVHIEADDPNQIRSEQHDADRAYFWHHLKCLFMKRVRIVKRDWGNLLLHLLVPVLSITAGFFIVVWLLNAINSHPLEFNANKLYGDLTPLQIPISTQNPMARELVKHVHNGAFQFVPMPDSAVQDPTGEALAEWLLRRSLPKEAPLVFAGAMFYEVNGYTNLMLAANSTIFHLSPTLINALDTAFIRMATGREDVQVKVTTAAWPRPARYNDINAFATAFVLLFVIVMALGGVANIYSRYVVREREAKAKHQQFVSGVTGAAYWSSMWLFDMAQYLTLITLVSIAIAALRHPTFSGEGLWATIVVFLAFGLSVIPFAHLTSFLFKNPNTNQQVMTWVYFLTGTILVVTSMIMGIAQSTKNVDKVLRPIWRLFPTFNLAHALGAITMHSVFDFVAKEASELSVPSLYDWEYVGLDLAFLLVEAVLYFLLVLWVENELNKPAGFIYRWRPDPYVMPANNRQDPDVVAEAQRVQQSVDTIRLEGLRKVYRAAPPKVAVENLWFGVPQGQCFGYLGNNGAGKSTTMAMLTGEFPPTQGSGKLAHFDILHQQKELRRNLGYCPQFDALFEHLTGREHLELYANIKGVSKASINRLVEGMLTALNLHEHADKMSRTYSGGNKRKLSVACSLIGSPSIVFLDEPSTGMDPVSRRFMWNFISQTMRGRSVILVTHSMEEAEALCSRIGIMVNGELKCIGSGAHLKSRFGQGYTLHIKTGDNEQEQNAVERAVTQRFQGSTLTDNSNATLKFHLPAAATDLKLSAVFRFAEDNRRTLKIQDYSVSPTTLEDIFIQFAKNQRPDERNPLSP